MSYLRDKSSLLLTGVPRRAAKELVAELDEHLAAHSLLFHQYLKHAWLAPPPEVKALLREQGGDVLTHLNALAEEVVRLGGVPIAGPCEHENLGYLTFEREGVYSLEAMLDKDLGDEETVFFRLGVTLEVVRERGAARTEGVLEAARGAARERGRRLRRL